MDRQEFRGQERVVSVVHHHAGIVREATAQGREEARRIDAPRTVVREPRVAISGLVRGDARGHCRASRARRGRRRDCREQPAQHDGGVALERDARRIVRIENRGIDVDVDQVGRRLVAVAAGGDLAESRTHREQAVAILEGVFGGGNGGAAEAESGVQRVIARKRTQPLQRRADRRTEALRELDEFTGRIDGAPADVNAGTRGPCEQARSLLDRRGRAARLGGDATRPGRR